MIPIINFQINKNKIRITNRMSSFVICNSDFVINSIW